MTRGLQRRMHMSRRMLNRRLRRLAVPLEAVRLEAEAPRALADHELEELNEHDAERLARRDK